MDVFLLPDIRGVMQNAGVLGRGRSVMEVPAIMSSMIVQWLYAVPDPVFQHENAPMVRLRASQGAA
jgi:hypothetical protein